MNNTAKQIKRISRHSFDKWSKTLMDTPYLFSDWECQQVGENNEGPYRKGYATLKAVDNKEPLVNCGDYGLVSKDYYLNVYIDQIKEKKRELISGLENKNLYPFAWLRIGVVQKLVKADCIFRSHDLFLVVNSGWRNVQTQSNSKKLMKKEFGQSYIKKAIAPTGTSPHSSGGACDLELWSLQTGEPLSYSYPDDIINSFILEKQEKISGKDMIKRNIRRILFHVLANPNIALNSDEILTPHPGEFWHFSYGDRLSSFLRRKRMAIYDHTKPPKDYLLHNN